MTDSGGALPHVRPVVELFRSNVIAFWATTYSIDLALFNEFLLGRLGDPPLNIAILADQRQLAANLQRISPEMAGQVAFINRRWLLRGAQLGAGRFHPKSYLAVTPSKTTLLVGSGNLSTSGLDEGREVFTEFVSGTDEGDDAIAAWRSWMRRLVARVGDTRLAERFADLEAQLPGANGSRAAVGASLLDNLDEAIATKLARAIRSQISGAVDELLVAAPFYDKKAEALGFLISQLAPQKISVYTTSTTSVDGLHLARTLEESGAEVNLFAYEPDRFTHAKLVGVLAGGDAWVLSGSANLSRAALTLTATEGNVELAVLAFAQPAVVRQLFMPPDASVREIAFSDVSILTYQSDTDPEGLPIRLLQATARAEGTIEVRCDPAARVGWQLDDLAERRGLVNVSGQTYTDGRLNGHLVCIVDHEGVVLSNRVVVDDPDALDAMLRVRSKTADDRPPELLAGDLDTPVGKALAWLHRNLVMDVSERVSSGAGSGGLGLSEVDSVTDDDLWERLEREKLGRDPRANTYGRILGRSAGIGADQPILELLEAMRDRAPSIDRSGSASEPISLLALLREDAEREKADGADDHEGRRVKRHWKTETRIRVRARNVLRRWAAAQTDPRLVWVDHLAPAGNFAMIARMFARLWLVVGADPARCELRADDLNDLWFDWMRPFVGTGRGNGWLDQLDLADATVTNRLPADLPETVSALCWLAVKDANRDTTIAWQPIVSAALSHDLLEPSEEAARFLEVVTHSSLTRSDVEVELLRCIEFIDDDLWCERTGEELGLGALKLQAVSSGQDVAVRLGVEGVENPLRDPRIPQLIVIARRYRRCDGVAVAANDAGWRIAVNTGASIAYCPDTDAPMLESEDVPAGAIEQMATAGGILADLFVRDEVV